MGGRGVVTRGRLGDESRGSSGRSLGVYEEERKAGGAVEESDFEVGRAAEGLAMEPFFSAVGGIR